MDRRRTTPIPIVQSRPVSLHPQAQLATSRRSPVGADMRSRRTSFHGPIPTRPPARSASPAAPHTHQITLVYPSPPPPPRRQPAVYDEPTPYIESPSHRRSRYVGLTAGLTEPEGQGSESSHESSDGGGLPTNRFHRYHNRQQGHRHIDREPSAPLMVGVYPVETSSDPWALDDAADDFGRLRSKRSAALLSEKPDVPLRHRKGPVVGPSLDPVTATASPPASPDPTAVSLPRLTTSSHSSGSRTPSARTSMAGLRIDTRLPPNARHQITPPSTSTSSRVPVPAAPPAPATTRTEITRTRSSTLAAPNVTPHHQPWPLTRRASAIPDDVLKTAGMSPAEQLRHDTRRAWRASSTTSAGGMPCSAPSPASSSYNDSPSPLSSTSRRRDSIFSSSPPPPPPPASSLAPGDRRRKTVSGGRSDSVHRVVLHYAFSHPSARACLAAIARLRDSYVVGHVPKRAGDRTVAMEVEFRSGVKMAFDVSWYPTEDLVRKVRELDGRA